jgi:hypothetical protein
MCRVSCVAHLFCVHLSAQGAVCGLEAPSEYYACDCTATFCQVLPSRRASELCGQWHETIKRQAIDRNRGRSCYTSPDPNHSYKFTTFLAQASSRLSYTVCMQYENQGVNYGVAGGLKIQLEDSWRRRQMILCTAWHKVRINIRRYSNFLLFHRPQDNTRL